MVSRATGKVIYVINDVDIFGLQYGQSPYASCVFFEKNRCLTNAHVFLSKPVGEIIIQIQQQNKAKHYKAVIDYWDGKTDLVILKTKKKVSIEPVKLARNCTVGEDTMYGGYGNFPSPKIRFGKLNYDSQYGFYVNDMYYGDSGAGIFNMKGELLGIFYSIFTLKAGNEETFRGYAVPLEALRQFLNDELGKRVEDNQGRDTIY